MADKSSTASASSTQVVIAALQAMDNLGFDYVTEARRAIIAHDDYAQRWEIDAQYQELIAAWRRSTLAGKAVR